jgi:glutamate synthase domain-containing protein 3
MKRIDASGLSFRELNEQVRRAGDGAVTIDNCNGQRYIGAGLSGVEITVNGTPGNGLGAYMDGARVLVNGNVQDAAGDTMNDGLICVYGSAGDAAGYAMRGGRMYIRDDAGYRAGIHMKAYRDKLPVIVIGGRAGSFLGEYQAGGVIIVLGGGCGGKPPIGNFCGTGMHGGSIFLRCDELPQGLPAQVEARRADIAEIAPCLDEYCGLFGLDGAALKGQTFYVLTPNTKNPYKQLYTHI